ncbi:uncharacterized protein VP01_7535g1, partial [Puccinia sorghi]
FSLFVSTRLTTSIEKNEEDPVALWKLLTDHYEAKTSGNHVKVYNDFITFQFKGNDLSVYLETVDEHLKLMSSIGMKFEGPDCNIVKEVLHNKRQDISITSASVKTEETAMKASPPRG